MPCSRLLLFPLLAGLTVTIAGALTLQTSSAPATAPPPVWPLQLDPAATATLEQAIAASAATRKRWVQARVLQKVHVPSLEFQVDGIYRSGPNHRLRLDLQVRTDAKSNRLLIVSDGQTIWQERQAADAPAAISRLELGRLLKLLDSPHAVAAARDEFHASHFFAGPEPLLRNLRQAVTFTRQERLRWRDQDIWLLTGARTAEAEDPKGCAHYHPRQCRLYVDVATFWPHRLEWWGPAPKQLGDLLLSELELRSPVFDQPPPDEVFMHQPSSTAITDTTAHWVQALSPPE